MSIRPTRSSLSVVSQTALSAFGHLRKARGSAHARAHPPRLRTQHHDDRRGGTRSVRCRASARRLFSRRKARRRRRPEARRDGTTDASLHRRPRRRAVVGRGRAGPQSGVRSAEPRSRHRVGRGDCDPRSSFLGEEPRRDVSPAILRNATSRLHARKSVFLVPGRVACSIPVFACSRPSDRVFLLLVLAPAAATGSATTARLSRFLSPTRRPRRFASWRPIAPR